MERVYGAIVPDLIALGKGGLDFTRPTGDGIEHSVRALMEQLPVVEAVDPGRFEARPAVGRAEYERLSHHHFRRWRRSFRRGRRRPGGWLRGGRFCGAPWPRGRQEQQD